MLLTRERYEINKSRLQAQLMKESKAEGQGEVGLARTSYRGLPLAL